MSITIQGLVSRVSRFAATLGHLAVAGSAVAQASSDNAIERRMIYASSSEVYGTSMMDKMDETHALDAPHPYGASKIAADRMCYSYAMTYKMPIVIFRCFNVYGPRQKDFGYGGVISLFMRKAMRGEPLIIYGDGEQSRGYTYVTDAIAAYLMPLDDEWAVGPWNVGRGVEYTINGIAELINNLCGRKSLTFWGAARSSEVRRLCCDNTKIKLCGWRPTVDLQTGLENLHGWFQENGTEGR